MPWLTRLWNTFRLWRLDRELDEELQLHLDLSARDLEASGLSRQAARAEARLRLGNITLQKERTRDMDVSSALESISKDLQYALRQLFRNRGFAAVAIASLALGIGANTAIFCVLNVVLLQTLPVPHPEQLVILTDPETSGAAVGTYSGERVLLSYVEYTRLRDGLTSSTGPLSGVCASGSGLNHWSLQISAGPAEPALGRLVSEDFFSVLGIGPSLGRVFRQSDAGSVGSDPYAVLSYDYWQHRFGGRADIIGAHIRLYNAALTVIGVAQPGFYGETGGEKPDLWVPMMMEPLVKPGRDWLHEDLSKSIDKVLWLHVFGRLKPGFTLAQLQARANTTFHALLEEQYPRNFTGNARKELLDQHLRVRSARSGAFLRRTVLSEQILVLLVVAGLVLAIACANVANLLLARATARRKEISIRLSLGAARSRLFRQFLTESLVLSAFAGLAGIALAFLFRKLLLLFLAAHEEDLDMSVPFDGTVLLFTLALSIATGLLFGVMPASVASRVDIVPNRDPSYRRKLMPFERITLAKTLVAVQVGLSLLLVTGAGLFLRTLWNLQSVQLGFSKQHLLLFRVDAITPGYSDAQRPRIYDDIAGHIRAVPGVTSVAYSENGFFGGTESQDPIRVDGYTPPKGEDPSANFDQLGPRYFSALGIPLLLGREIDERDTATSPRVCVVNEALARKFFAGRNPIGSHVIDTYGGRAIAMEVVGISKNVRDHALRSDIPPRMYVPLTQGMDGIPGSVYFSIRTVGDPSSTLKSVRRAILQVNSEMPILLSRTMDEMLDNLNTQPRIIAQLCIAFGLIALLLASTGLYGVLSYVVSRRTNEIGIRMAIGADRRQILSLIFRETGLLVAFGMALGLFMTYASTRLVASRLYGLTPLDPATILIAALILATAAVAASCLPALRAARVDPTTALRYD